MMMHMLAAGGTPIVSDGVRQPDENNPNGYFELERVLTLDKGGDHAWLRGARGRAVKVVSALLPHLPASNDYRVIFMHRDLDEVIRSQNRMLALRGAAPGTSADDARMREAFEAHLLRIRTVLSRRRCFDVLDVAYGDVVARPLAEAHRINVFLGGRLDAARMAGVVNPALYRNRGAE